MLTFGPWLSGEIKALGWCSDVGGAGPGGYAALGLSILDDLGLTRWIYTRGTVAMELDHAVVQDMATRVRAPAPEEHMAEAIGLHGLALSLSIDRRSAAEEALKLAIDDRPEIGLW